jgi:hypothetical protein
VGRALGSFPPGAKRPAQALLQHARKDAAQALAVAHVGAPVVQQLKQASLGDLRMHRV